jgi:hypothetical protein
LIRGTAGGAREKLVNCGTHRSVHCWWLAMKRINIECRELSDAERLAVAEELYMPAGEFFAMLFGAILLLLFLLTWLKLR